MEHPPRRYPLLIAKGETFYFGDLVPNINHPLGVTQRIPGRPCLRWSGCRTVAGKSAVCPQSISTCQGPHSASITASNRIFLGKPKKPHLQDMPCLYPGAGKHNRRFMHFPWVSVLLLARFSTIAFPSTWCQAAVMGGAMLGARTPRSHAHTHIKVQMLYGALSQPAHC